MLRGVERDRVLGLGTQFWIPFIAMKSQVPFTQSSSSIIGSRAQCIKWKKPAVITSQGINRSTFHVDSALNHERGGQIAVPSFTRTPLM